MTRRINEQVRNVAAPNLPLGPAAYEQRFQDQYSNVLRLFFTSVANAINSPVVHGSFYDTTTQTNPVASAVNLVTYNSTVSAFNVSIGAIPSRVYVAETGVYNIQFSMQLDKTGGGASDVYIWLRKNGANVANSATKIVINGPNAEVVAAWNFMIDLAANDYFQLAWQSADTNVILAAAAASGNIPEIPSVILTVTYVSVLDV